MDCKNQTKKWGLVPLGLIVATTFLAAGVQAATIGTALLPPPLVSVVPATSNVLPGATFSVDLVGSDFTPTSGGSMDVSWDPAVITMTDVVAGVAIPSPPWANPDISFFSSRGTRSSGLLSGLRVGIFPEISGTFSIATLTFTAVGAIGSTTPITVADAAAAGGGWGGGGTSLAVAYNPGTLNVVPEPLSMALVGSSLFGLLALRRRHL